MIRPTLKPCPFCGCEAEILGDESDGLYQVACTGCCCELSYFFDTPEEAAEYWNDRPAQDGAKEK